MLFLEIFLCFSINHIKTCYILSVLAKQFDICYLNMKVTWTCKVHTHFSFFLSLFIILYSFYASAAYYSTVLDMGETGKRFRHHENDGKNQKRRSGNMENSGDGELVLYRILCPNIVIGSVIGKSGKVINSLRQETFAKIKVVDPFPGADKRVISIYCYVKDKDTREVDEDAVRPLCPAQNALLKMHAAIVNALENSADSDKKHKEEALILVPASQAANIIGKSGATIKRLRLKTKANIKVYPKDPNDASHSCAMSFDNFVSVTIPTIWKASFKKFNDGIVG